MIERTLALSLEELAHYYLDKAVSRRSFALRFPIIAISI